jgi:hypothetical protein
MQRVAPHRVCLSLNVPCSRANLDCDFWNDPLDILLGKKPASAHCLTFDPAWYSVSGKPCKTGGCGCAGCASKAAVGRAWPPCGSAPLQAYELGAAALQFEIQVAVAVPTAPAPSPPPPRPPRASASPPPAGNASAAAPAQGSGEPAAAPAAVTEVLTLSPSVPLATSAGRLLSAKLLGDLAMYTQLPVIRQAALQGATGWLACAAWAGSAGRTTHASSLFLP